MDKMLPKEQIENIKKQLFDQLEKTDIPNREEIKSSVETMDAEQLEEFLIQNCIFPQFMENLTFLHKVAAYIFFRAKMH